MKRVIIIAVVFALAMFVVAGTTSAAPAKLKTFGTGDVTVTGSDSATIVNGSGEYGGVYIQSKSQSGKLLGNATFQFTSRGDTAGGAPRFSIPVNDGSFDPNSDYAFLDAPGCGAPVQANAGTWLVSTQNPACHVNFHGTDYANWAAFASANPTYKIASGYIPFVISDQPGSYDVTDIVLR